MQFPAGELSVTNDSRLLVSPEFAGVTSDWFEPIDWGVNAVVVDAGGRGGAWFLRSEVGDLVLRHYRRGGLAGRLVEHTYFYSGLRRSRSFCEFQLTREMHQAGLPVPRVVAAIVWPHALLWYRAAIIVERIPSAINLPNSTDVLNGSLWCQVGRMIRRFHDWGLDHVDLNCDNILVANGVSYLIDFDRCRRRSEGSSQGWRTSNLQRFRRSVDKRLGSRVGPEIERLWQHLLSGYHGSLS